MKKILLFFITCMFISINMRAEQSDVIDLEDIFLPDSITLKVGGDTILVAVFDPEDATDKSMTWTIVKGGDEFVSIDTTSTTDKTTCIVTGIKDGEAKIAVKAFDGNWVDTCVITVVTPVEGMVLNENTMDLILEEDSILIARIIPEKVSNDSVIWISRDSSIVDIISTIENRFDTVCRIIAVSRGSTWIVAKTVDGGFRDSCFVTTEAAPIEEFTLNYDSIDVQIGDNATILAHIRPLQGTLKSVNWRMEGDNNEYVTIISSGRDTICTVKALKVGEGKVVATIQDGLGNTFRDTCVVTVKGIPVEGMSLNKDSLELNINTDTLVLTAIFSPANATNDSIYWISTDSTIVDITSSAENMYDISCQIKALRSGTAKIIAKTIDGGFLDTCVVTVVVPIESIVISSVSHTLIDGDRISMNLKDDTVAILVAKVYPENATYKPLIWHKLDTLTQIDSIPSLHNDTLCYIKALWWGVDTIKVSTADGIESSFFFVNIDIREVDSVKIDKGDNVINDTLKMDIGDSFEVIANTFPYNATNDSVIVESDYPVIAKVDSTATGVYIRALSVGRAIVRVRPADGLGGKIDSCIIEVKSKDVESLRLNKDTVYIYEQNVDSIIATMLPYDATDKSIEWTSSKTSVVIQPSGSDSVCIFKGLSVDTAYIYAVSRDNNLIKDSCVVIVREQFVFVESNTTGTPDGKISFSLLLSDDSPLTGSFRLELPKGFGLTRGSNTNGYRTALENSFSAASNLEISRINDSTYIFNITPKTTPSSIQLRSEVKDTFKIMDIAYTIYDNTLSAGVYDAKFVDVDFSSGDDQIAKEDLVIVGIRPFADLTANDFIDNEEVVPAYIFGNRVYVNTDKAEVIYIYSLNGSLILQKEKAEGPAVFNIKTQDKVLFIKGSSGWSVKAANK